MIYIMLFIICLCASWMLAEYLPFEHMNLFKHILESNNLFCMEYLCFSCIFLVFDAFSVWKVLICVLTFESILLFILFIKKVQRKKWQRESCSKQERIFLLVIICFIVPLIHTTSEDISADTDQGAYFLHTCILMEEKSKEIHSLQEIGKISEEVDAGIRELQKDLLCFYHESNEDIYSIHALNSWCSYTALFGKMFGIWNSMRAVNYIYILVIINMFYVVKKKAENKYSVYLYILIFALSPLLLYIGKAGLSEIAVLYLFTLSLDYMLEKETIFSLISGGCIGLIGYVHVSMYVYIPAITGIALLESTRKKKIAYLNIVQLLMFGVSVWYINKVSPIYTELQYLRFTFHEKIDYTVIFILIDIIVAVCAFVQVFVIVKQNKFLCRLRRIMYENYKKIAVIVWGVILARTLYYAYFMSFTNKYAIAEGLDAGTWNLRSNYINQGIKAISYLNLINIARATGIIGIFILIAIPFLNYKLSDTVKSFYFVALYGMIIFTVFQMDTPSNYYSSRYFVPVLITAIVLCLTWTMRKKNWIIYFMLVALLYNHHFWPSFFKGGPKVGQYNLLQDVLEVIPANAVVFCNPESHTLNTRLTGNLRVLNDNEIYNLKNIEEVLNFYPDKNAYIISENAVEGIGDLILSNEYISQYSFGNGADGRYATSYGTYEIPLYLYKISVEE